MSLTGNIARWWSYLFGKRSELKELDLKDAVLAKTVLDIHRKSTGKKLTAVALHSVRPIHRLDRENSLKTTRERTRTLSDHREELLAARTITCELLGRYMPSVSRMKVVQDQPGKYLAFEGNGRLAAMQAVFSATDNMSVEVEEYLFRGTKKIVRRLNRVRRMNELSD